MTKFIVAFRGVIASKKSVVLDIGALGGADG
jgi:hypothetical protein